MARDIAAVNRSHLIAVTDDGLVCEITNMFDADGEETDDFNKAVVGIVRVGDDEWFTVAFEDYETVRVHWMALIVEDGSGMMNADAFISVAYADEYHLAMGNATWTGDEADKEGAIRRATAFLSNSYQWQGYKRQGRPQALAWPRVDVVDREGWGVAFDAVPIEIQKATAEIALRELMSPGSMNPDFLASEQVKREKIGQIEVEYLNASMSAQSARPVLLIVQDIIGPLLKAGAGNSIVGSSYRV